MPGTLQPEICSPNTHTLFPSQPRRVFLSSQLIWEFFRLLEDLNVPIILQWHKKTSSFTENAPTDFHLCPLMDWSEYDVHQQIFVDCLSHS